MEHKQQPDGYLVLPQGGKGDGVLVLHAWWGLNDTIKKLCDRLADAGFVAFAPDLYHGKVAKTIPEAEVLGKNVDANHHRAKAEIAEASKYLAERVGPSERSLAVMGFSLGAYYAVDLAAHETDLVRSVVLFYGTGDSDLSNSKAAFLGHYAENDEYEPRSSADAMEEYLKRVGRPVEFYHYSGTQHWFFEPDRTGEYNQAAANLAWERTLTFLKRSASK